MQKKKLIQSKENTLPVLSKETKALRYILEELKNYSPKIKSISEILKKIDLNIPEIKISMTEILMKKNHFLIKDNICNAFEVLNTNTKKELISKLVADYYKNKYTCIYLRDEEPEIKLKYINYLCNIDESKLNLKTKTNKLAKEFDLTEKESEYIIEVYNSLKEENAFKLFKINDLQLYYNNIKIKQETKNSNTNTNNRHRLLIRCIHMLKGKHIANRFESKSALINYFDLITNAEHYLDLPAYSINKLIYDLISMKILRFNKKSKQYLIVNSEI